MKVNRSVYMSAAHHELLSFMVMIIRLDRRENRTSLLERLTMAYAKQMVNNVLDEATRGKLLELINNAEKNSHTSSQTTK